MCDTPLVDAFVIGSRAREHLKHITKDCHIIPRDIAQISRILSKYIFDLRIYILFTLLIAVFRHRSWWKGVHALLLIPSQVQEKPLLSLDHHLVQELYHLRP